jgi:hypothetical protein
MANNFPNLLPSLNIDNVNGIYVDPRITFTRAGTRTYYGQEVVKAEENLLLQSQTFETTWSSARLVIAANDTTAPDGTTTADKLTQEAGQTTSGVVFQGLFAPAVGQSYTLSIYAKAGTGRDFIILDEAIRNGSSLRTWFNIGAGTVGTTNANHTASIVNEGDGWYRCIVTLTVSIAGSARSVFFRVAETDNSATVTDNEGFIYVWGAQLEQRSFATAYTATTTQPITNYNRLLETAAANEWPREFDPVTGECLGRSIWESRTNLLLRSEEFDNASWVKTGATVSANQVIAPDGTLSADIITLAATQFINQQIIATYSAGAAYTFSMYVKQEARAITWGGATAAGTDVFNSILVGNGWYRHVLTRTFTSSGTGVAIQAVITSGSFPGIGSFTYWGAQLEVGAFATPYTPTVASQVTRLADSAVMTGTNFSSWFNPSEGTLFFDGAGVGTSSAVVTLAEGASANNRIQISVGPSGASNLIMFAAAGGSTQVSLNGTPTTSNKVSGSYLFNDYKACLNGGTVGTDTVALVPVVDNFRLGQTVGTTFSGYYRRVTYYPQALTAANLQAVTR